MSVQRQRAVHIEISNVDGFTRRRHQVGTNGIEWFATTTVQPAIVGVFENVFYVSAGDVDDRRRRREGVHRLRWPLRNPSEDARDKEALVRGDHNRTGR